MSPRSVTELVDAVDGLVAAAPPVPLTGQVRVDEEAAHDVLDELRDVAPAQYRERSERWDLGGLIDALDALDALLHDAPSVPLTGHKRVAEDRLRAAAGDLRRALETYDRPQRPPPTRPLPEVVDAIEGLAAGARPVPLTGQVRLDREDAHALLDELRRAVAEHHQAGRLPAGPEGLLAALDALDDALRAAPAVPLTGQARVSRADLAGYVADLRRAAPRW